VCRGANPHCKGSKIRNSFVTRTYISFFFQRYHFGRLASAGLFGSKHGCQLQSPESSFLGDLD
jgi:hypothetical protein